MQVTAEEVLAAAMQLTVNERLYLAARLLDAAAPDDGCLHLDDPGLIEELDGRAADQDLGIPWHELREEGSSA